MKSIIISILFLAIFSIALAGGIGSKTFPTMEEAFNFLCSLPAGIKETAQIIAYRSPGSASCYYAVMYQEEGGK